MPTHLVNLDALIQREDFESGEAEAGSNEPLFKVEELASGKLYYRVLRKPDFQRDTSNWDPQTIVEFVRSFLDGELIPALILWHSKETNKVFVIDGAHRLSALVAWVNDDYGDGPISQRFFDFRVPDAQKRFHQETKRLIESEIGSFQQLMHIGLNEEAAPSAKALRRARAIATKQPPIQKVEGDAKIAEISFFKINGNQTAIDPTELDIIRARRKPNAIATRALMRAGTGYKYWNKFPEMAAEIEALAEETYNSLFGQIVEIGAQSPDVPRAGQPYSAEAFRMIFDMVNVFNEVSPAMWREEVHRNTRRKKEELEKLVDDPDGRKTIDFLKRIRTVGTLIAGNSYSGSLGLDQAVYSYGATGKFHSAAFLASLKFAQYLRAEGMMYEFTGIRKEFEDFLVRHKRFINSLLGSKGSRTRPLDSIVTMHKALFEQLRSGIHDDNVIVAQLRNHDQLKELGLEVINDEVTTQRRRFSKSVEQAAVIREVLAARSRCTECGARLPPYSRSKDHIKRSQDGGLGSIENLQFTHPYCNTGYKEAKHAHELKYSAVSRP